MDVLKFLDRIKVGSWGSRTYGPVGPLREQTSQCVVVGVPFPRVLGREVLSTSVVQRSSYTVDTSGVYVHDLADLFCPDSKRL